jgi:hypothetical protein
MQTGNITPEVIQWYNKLKQEVYSRNRKLENRFAAEFIHSDPFRKDHEKRTPCTLLV